MPICFWFYLTFRMKNYFFSILELSVKCTISTAVKNGVKNSQAAAYNGDHVFLCACNSTIQVTLYTTKGQLFQKPEDHRPFKRHLSIGSETH